MIFETISNLQIRNAYRLIILKKYNKPFKKIKDLEVFIRHTKILRNILLFLRIITVMKIENKQ